MAVKSDYVTGSVTLTNGSTAFTGAGTAWALAGFREGDEIKQVAGQTQWEAMVATIDSNTAGTLVRPWGGATGTYAYRMRFQPDGSRVTAQARELIELLGDGTLLSLAGLVGPGVIELLPGGGAQVVPKTDLVSGANYDIQVADLAARAAYDGQAAGFAVLVSNVGDGRAAIYSKVTNASGNWSAAAYVTGLPSTTPGPSGVVWRGAYAAGTTYAINDGVTFNGSSFRKLTTAAAGTSPSGASPPVNTAAWEVLAAKGLNGTGTGDVVGPATSITDRLALFSDATGKLIKQAAVLVSDLMLKTTGLSNDQALAGSVVASAFAKFISYTTVSNVLPVSGAAPSSTAGDAILSVTITPKSTTNKFRSRVTIPCTRNNAGNIMATLVHTGGATADEVGITWVASAGEQRAIAMQGEFTPGVITPMTVTVRVGPGDSGGTMHINGNQTQGFFGGAWGATLSVEEIKG